LASGLSSPQLPFLGLAVGLAYTLVVGQSPSTNLEPAEEAVYCWGPPGIGSIGPYVTEFAVAPTASATVGRGTIPPSAPPFPFPSHRHSRG
jgi:hypothetical protein